MLCPKCKLENSEGTMICECGYNFETGMNIRPLIIPIVIFLIFILGFGCLYINNFFADTRGLQPYKADAAAASYIETSVALFFAESNCTDLSGLYDMYGNKIVFKQNDQESMKRLITTFQEPIYYKGSVYGPYIESNIKLCGRKNKGFRLEISDDSVRCFPVEKKSEAVIVFLRKSPTKPCKEN